MISDVMLERKQRSEAKLKANGVPVHPRLVYEESESAFRFQTAQDVAKRALALYNLLGVIFYEKPEEIVDWVKNEGLWSTLSPKEREIFEIPVSDLDEGEKVWKLRAMQSHRITWRTEALWALLWAMGEIEGLEWPTGQCDASWIGHIMPSLGDPTEPFIQNAQLRPVSEILDEADLVYRLMWAIQEEGEKIPEDIETFTVYERFVALEWLTHGLQWDELTE